MKISHGKLVGPVLIALLAGGVVGFLGGRASSPGEISPQVAGRDVNSNTNQRSTSGRAGSTGTAAWAANLNSTLSQAVQNVLAAAKPGVVNEVLVRELQASLDDPSPSHRAARWVALLQEMRPEDALGVAGIFSDRDAKGQWFSDQWNQFWERYGEVDIDAAMAHPKLAAANLEYLKKTVIEGYARAQGVAAARFIPLEGEYGRSEYLKAVITGIASRDPNAATTLLQSIGSPAERRTLVTDIAWGAVYKGGLSGGEQWLATLGPEKSDETEAAFSTLCESARRGAREVAADFILRHLNDPWCEPKHIGQIISSYASALPPEALDFAGKLPARVANVKGLDTLVQKCVQADPDMVGLWLREHRQAQGYDAIVQAYATSVESIDPEAAQAWRKTIKDPTLRPPEK